MAARIEEMDAQVTFAEQLSQETGPVVLMNVFTVSPDNVERFPEIWRENAAYMERQPGFISAQLHRGIAGSGVFVNVAVWESAAALATASRSPDFQAYNALLPDGIVARPHLFEKVAVAGICVA